MKTFLAWLIANICGIVDFFIIVIFEIFLFKEKIPTGEADIASLAIMGPFLILSFHGIAGGMPSKNFTGDMINLCILILEYILAWYLWENSPNFPFLTIYVWGSIPSLIIALITAIFTANNMDEVVSRRMLYRNSNANIFEIKLLYTFNRFIAVFSAFSYIFLFISLLKKFSV